jgi:hypothetical protein
MGYVLLRPGRLLALDLLKILRHRIAHIEQPEKNGEAPVMARHHGMQVGGRN